MAKAKVKEADASATEKMGQAKAVEIREKLLAEAQGLEQKAEAMKKLDERSRSHEEYRLRLEKLVEVEMAALGVRVNPAFAGAYVFDEQADFTRLFPGFLDGLSADSVVMCHPGFVDDELRRLDPLTTLREHEYAYLASDDFSVSLAQRGVTLA